jgi:hypothetical protein
MRHRTKQCVAIEAKRVINAEFSRLGAASIPFGVSNAEFARITQWRTSPRHAWLSLDKVPEAERYLLSVANEITGGRELKLQDSGCRFYVGQCAA